MFGTKKSKLVTGLAAVVCVCCVGGVSAQYAATSFDVSPVGAETSAVQSETPAVYIESKNVSYSDSLYILYAVSHEGFDSEQNAIKMLFWNEPQTDYTVENAVGVTTKYVETVNGKECEVFYSEGIAAKEMTDVIYCRAYVELEGEIYYSDVEKYSVMDYVYTMREEGNLSGEQQETFTAMLDYGAAAQKLFAYNTDRLANANFYKVSVEGGVLTAVGTGTTVIHASYEDRQVSCTAGCLAQTREELEAMDPKILSQPKWLPPEVDMDEPCTYFDNAAIVGDSITYGMMQHESQSNGLGNILFMARGGVSIRGFVVRNKNIIFRGRETDLEVAIAQSGVERVFFLMGSNDVGAQYTMEAMMDDWRVILDRIWSESPDVEIVLITSIPRYEEYPYRQSPDSYNPRTVEYNQHLRQFAKENGCMFLDLHSYVQDHWGRLSPTYKIDDTHLNEVACTYWMQVMRYYAQYESEGGILE